MTITENEKEEMIKTLLSIQITSNKKLLQYIDKHREFRKKRNLNKRNVAKLSKLFEYLGKEKYRKIVRGAVNEM